jgi:hypothetical protein
MFPQNKYIDFPKYRALPIMKVDVDADEQEGVFNMPKNIYGIFDAKGGPLSNEKAQGIIKHFDDEADEHKESEEKAIHDAEVLILEQRTKVTIADQKGLGELLTGAYKVINKDAVLTVPKYDE